MAISASGSMLIKTYEPILNGDERRRTDLEIIKFKENQKIIERINNEKRMRNNGS